ncbi:hypothetical protein [Streptomyces phaeochromogenes]
MHRLAARADSLAVPVVIDTPWAVDPATTAEAARIKATAHNSATIEVFTATGTAPASSLLAQLALLRTTIGEITGVRLSRLDTHAHAATARAGSVPVLLSGVRSALGTTETRLVLRGAGEQWRLRYGDPRIARPATVLYIDEHGERLLPTVYESAHRAAWRHTHIAAMSGATPPPYTLHDLAADLALVPTEALRA